MKNQSKPVSKNILKVVETNSLETIEKELVVKTLGELTQEVLEVKKEIANIKQEYANSIILSEEEAFDLNNLFFSAIWYNDECNNGGFNKVIEILMTNLDKTNSSEILNCIQFLNKVAFSQSLINSMHDRTKSFLDSIN